MENQNPQLTPGTKEPPPAGKMSAAAEPGAQPLAKAIKLAGHRIHPACALFPELPPDQLAALAKSIKEQGQLVPIVMLDGQVLDGRSRFFACESAGVEPVIKDASDVPAFKNVKHDPYAFVVAMNLSRRHLSDSERILIAGKIANLKNGQHKQAGPIGLAVAERKSIADAAQLLEVPPRSVKRAKRIHESGVPELLTAVKQNQVSISAAADVASLPPAEQKAVVEAGPEQVKKAAKAVRQAKGAKTQKAPEREPCGGWQKLSELADSVEKSAAEITTLSIDAQHRIQARKLCERLAEKFSKLAVKLGGEAADARPVQAKTSTPGTPAVGTVKRKECEDAAQ